MKKSEVTSLSTFRLDKEGFPLAGEVIRYYRKRMTYTESSSLQVPVGMHLMWLIWG